ncbi:MAG: phosphoadenosine phosphosulfate reductase family protein, partial [Staphylococcus epidermidis]|nr:phosphoadenosine phosphosulfate reductase family protein [Staphylococcus epidermidis]
MNSKHYLDIDVYTMAMKRIEYIFEHFKTITIAFSGGKDSGVMLNLAVDYCNTHDVADHNIYVSFLDYEVQYTETIKYVERTLSSLPEYFHVL